MTSQAEPLLGTAESTDAEGQASSRLGLTAWEARLLVLATVGAGAAFALTLRAQFLAYPGWLAVQKADLILGPVLVGLYWRRRRPASRFGVVLVGFGLLQIPYGLQSSSHSALFTVGVLWELAIYLMTAALILTFPTGRLDAKLDRLILGSAVLFVAVPYVASFLSSSSVQVTGSISACKLRCPPNALLLMTWPGSPPALTKGLHVALVAVALAIAFVLIRRFVKGTPPTRRALAVGAPVALVFLLSQAVYQATLLVAPGTAPRLHEIIRWTIVGTRAFIWYGFLLALVAAELYASRVLKRIVGYSLEHPRLDDLEDILREPLGDSSLRLGFWRPSRVGWLTNDGALLDSHPPPGHDFTRVDRHGTPAVAIVHDERLADDPELIQAAGATALLAYENAELERAWTNSLDDLRLSRARIARTNDVQRHRIEQELHAGVQQRLLAMRVRLALVDGLERGSGESSALADLETDLDAAISAIRGIAHEIYPQLLVDSGLVEALRASTFENAGALEVRGTVGRYPPEIELAVYHCCLDAVQPALDRLGPTQLVTIELDEHQSGNLRFVVRSPFFEGSADANGMLQDLEDRVGAFGGSVEIAVNSGIATIVTGSVPTHRAVPAPAA